MLTSFTQASFVLLIRRLPTLQRSWPECYFEVHIFQKTNKKTTEILRMIENVFKKKKKKGKSLTPESHELARKGCNFPRLKPNFC